MYVIKVERVSQGSTEDQKHKEHPWGKKDTYQGMFATCLWPHTDMLVCGMCGGQRWQKRLSRAQRAQGLEAKSRQGAECTQGMKSRDLR